MYRKMLKSTFLFLKDNWLYSIIAFTAYFLLNAVVLFLPFGIWINLALILLFMPLQVGIINCFESAKYGHKHEFKKLFYFYTDFKLIYKSVIIAFLYDNFVRGVIYIMGARLLLNKLQIEKIEADKMLFVIPLTLILLIVCVIVQLYFFLSAYIFVKNPEWSLIEIFKCSFKKIKGNINSLFWIQIIFGLSTRWLDIPFEIENVFNSIIIVIVLFAFIYIIKILLYNFADLILTGEWHESKQTYLI